MARPNREVVELYEYYLELCPVETHVWDVLGFSLPPLYQALANTPDITVGVDVEGEHELVYSMGGINRGISIELLGDCVVL
jgi:hypothetical protein